MSDKDLVKVVLWLPPEVVEYYDSLADAISPMVPELVMAQDLKDKYTIMKGNTDD